MAYRPVRGQILRLQSHTVLCKVNNISSNPDRKDATLATEGQNNCRHPVLKPKSAGRRRLLQKGLFCQNLAARMAAALPNPKQSPRLNSMSFVLLDNSLDADGLSHLFVDPLRMISVSEPDDVRRAIDDIADAVSKGLYAAGFLSYELGYALEPRLLPLLPRQRALPLLWMGLYRERRDLTPAESRRWLEQRTARDSSFNLSDLELSWSREQYRLRCQRVLDYIAAGDVYQINLTCKGKFAFEGDPIALYLDLRRRQKVAYGALISMPGFHLLSLSPELFLDVKGGRIAARPMKGTARRGFTPEEDARLRTWLATDVKSRAENLMIVDLMRNDLGRVSRIGGVSVPDLFTVETYRTVLQMTSGVEAELRDDVGLAELLAATFSPGSVTGAPKVRAMEIIRELEEEPREVYTGAIGMIGPGENKRLGDMAFNVAIRTLVLGDDGRGEIGVGGGVVQDSSPDGEYDECLLKMRFLSEPLPSFKLFESLRWQAGRGYYLLDRHVERLEASARHLGFVFDAQAVRAKLEAQATRCDFTQLAAPTQRVRVTLSEDGGLETSAAPQELPRPTTVFRFAVSDRPVSSANRLLYHKTTLRAFLDSERERMAAQTGCQEVLFVNEHGELTEGSFTNLFVRKKGKGGGKLTSGKLLTPALSCGLLPGTLRAELLASGEAEEAILLPDELLEAESVWLGNSVRGLIRAEPALVFEAATATE
jgi:para-aminobenzoate synthetase / 4-amino-4-deoxychorismate lyase